MPSKDVRNAIIALIILAGGSWFLTKLGKVFIPKDSPIDFTSFIAPIESLLNIFLIGIIVLIAILIPVWIAKKRGEKDSNQRSEKNPEQKVMP